ncbi:MAG: hypothetical protein Q9220_002929 [cf. Caloplaca sp. 1 TL-2023]
MAAATSYHPRLQALSEHLTSHAVATFGHGYSQEATLYKSAKWSPDGTTILTSTSDHTLTSYVLPSDLLSTTTTPHLLTPYTTHHSPEPVYATAFHPAYTLASPPSTLYLASPRALPIRLLSPFTNSILASYPLIKHTTEEYTAPHSLCFSDRDPNIFFAGSTNLISKFDISRDGEGPMERMPTVPSKRYRAFGGTGGIKGIVSALEPSQGGLLAAGTFSGWVGIYDGFGRGIVGSSFRVRDAQDWGGGKEEAGNGVSQVLWSPDGRYLAVAERCSDGVGVYDVRGTGERLAWLRGRNAKTNQRMSVEILGNEIWAGGRDGKVRVWGELGMREGYVDPAWEFRASEDAIASATFHSSGSVLATCSGQRHFGYHNDEDTGVDNGYVSPPFAATQPSILGADGGHMDENRLKLWAL